MRIGLGVAWLVVVAAEMIALRSGLGYMIMDSRNAGNRYDLVIAGMIIIGLIGLSLDGIMRMLERIKWVRWRYAHYSHDDSLDDAARYEVYEIREELDSDKGPLRIDHVSFEVRDGRVRRHRGTFGLRQDDADEHDRPGSSARTAARSSSTACRARSRTRSGILISQQGSVFPWLTVRENLMFGLNGHASANRMSSRISTRTSSG